jgi:hypothetical protein
MARAKTDKEAEAEGLFSERDYAVIAQRIAAEVAVANPDVSATQFSKLFREMIENDPDGEKFVQALLEDLACQLYKELYPRY